MKEQKTENKMGTARMLPLILKMSIPVMFSMLIQSLYNIVDSIFVSKVSGDAFTAVNIAFPVQMFMIAVAVGTGVGVNSLVSRRLGEQNHDEANSAATHGILLSVMSWLLFVIIGVFFAKPFIGMYTKDAEVLAMGTSYLRIVTILSVGIFVEVSIEKSLQATGNMIFPMIFQLIGAVTNIILDPIFIFVLDMGIDGAAIATVIGQILSMLFSIYVVVAKEHHIKISFKEFKVRLKTIRDIYVVGFPAIIMQSIGSVMISVLNKILGNMSEAALNVLGIYFKLQSFVFMPVFGLTQGLLPVIGYNFGAKNKKRIVSAIKIGSLIAVVIMGIGTLLFWIFPDKLIGIFEHTPEIMRIGKGALRTISLCFLPAALGIVFSSFFQAIAHGVHSLFISVLRQLVVLVPVAFFLSKYGETAVWYAFPVAEVFSLCASIIIFIGLYKKEIKQL